MKVYVGFNGRFECLSILDNDVDMAWLVDSTMEIMGEGKEKDVIACTSNMEECFLPTDVVAQVLKDGQFVVVVPRDLANKFDNMELCDRGSEFVEIDGNSLTTDMLYKLSNDKYKIRISEEALERVKQARELLDKIVREKQIVYGVSTGFGRFERTVIEPDQLEQLQSNLIESHCVGVGRPLPPHRVRMMMAVRTNILCKGHSGISLKNLNVIVQAFNASCLPYVPEKGTVGASGDLAPLSHVTLGLMGKGRMWSPTTGWSDAAEILQLHGIEPIHLGAKEGLAMINGTQFMTALGSEAVVRAAKIAVQADVVAALSVEILRGTSVAFDKDIHAARPHKGQNDVARRLRTLLNYQGNQSEITMSHRQCSRVQDAYSLRCCPQVHGIAHDTIAFVKQVLDTELNSATDNPMVFSDRNQLLSCGNFHGEYPAKVLDYLAIGVHEISSISERRIERMCNPSLSELPAFLVKNGGLNSGFMMAHCTAAALVSENKCLCHPSSVDSISTSAAQEDHVSMGGWAARKAITVVEHVERVIAIELLCACQGIDFHRPLKSTPGLEAIFKVVRNSIPFYDKDRIMHTDIDKATEMLKSGKILEAVTPFLKE